MTPEEFIAEAKRRGKSREETLRRYQELKAAGAFSEPSATAMGSEDIPQPAPAAPPMAESAAPMRPSQDSAWLERADAAIPDWMSEFAASFNKEVGEVIDFLGPDGINSLLSIAGSRRRVPTLVSERFTDRPGILTQAGIGQGGFMEPGTARDAVQTAGALTAAAGGFKSVPRSADKVGSVIADAIGAGSSAITSPIRNAYQDVAPYAEDLYQRATRPSTMGEFPNSADELSVLRREGNADTLGYNVSPETGRMVSDPRQKKAVDQGASEAIVTMVRDSPPAARSAMRRMLDIVDQSKKNALFEAKNRPGDVVGESITKRVKVIAAANRMAGKQVEDAAKSLKGQPIADKVRPAIESFIDDISDMGIKFDEQTGTLSFDGSDIEGLEGPINVVNRMIKRLYQKGKEPDAYDVHRVKRYIDEVVAYGKSQEGLSGRAARMLKSLRHNLDGVLDGSFPEYDQANSRYSETINALNSLQDAAGKRIDITGEGAETALGDLSRRILGNVVSRKDLMRSMDKIDRVAQRIISGEGAGTSVVPYRADLLQRTTKLSPEDLDDSLVGQIRFVSELEKMFGTNASNSFLGDISKATDRTAESMLVGDKTGPIREGYKLVRDRVRGINEENAMKALRELLKD
jgi:hypothetical protein